MGNPTRTGWLHRKIADVRRRMRVVEDTPTGSDWRKQQAKARVMASLRAEESKFRRMLPPEPDADSPF